jgi:hypothetical protein
VNFRHRPVRAPENPSDSELQTTFPSHFCYFFAFPRLSPMRPLDTSHSPVSPLFPLDTRKQGGFPPSQGSLRTDLCQFRPRSISLISILFPIRTDSRTESSSLYPLCALSFCVPYRKNRGRGEGCSFLADILGSRSNRVLIQAYSGRGWPGKRPAPTRDAGKSRSLARGGLPSRDSGQAG